MLNRLPIYMNGAAVVPPADPTNFAEFFGPNWAHFWSTYADASPGPYVFTDTVGGYHLDEKLGSGPDVEPTEMTQNGHVHPLFLDGVNRGLTRAGSPDFTTLDDAADWTVIFALKTYDGQAYGGIVVKGSAFYFEFSFGSGSLSLVIGAGGGADIQCTTPVNDDAWHRVIITCVGGTMRAYIDANLEGTDTGGTINGAIVNPLQIGVQPSGNTVCRAQILFAGIATVGVSALDISTLDDLIADYVGASSSPPNATGVLYANQFDTEGGEFFQIDGSGFTDAGGVTDVRVVGAGGGTADAAHFSVPSDSIVWCRAPASPKTYPGFSGLASLGNEQRLQSGVGGGGTEAGKYGAAGTIIFLYYANDTYADGGDTAPYQAATLLNNPDGAGSRLGIGVTDAVAGGAVRAGFYDGGSWGSRAVAAPLGQLNAVALRWDGVNAWVRANAGADATWATASPALAAGADFRIGFQSFDSTQLKGGVYRVLMFNTKLTDAEVLQVFGEFSRCYDAEDDLGIAPASFDIDTLSPTLELRPGGFVRVSSSDATWTDEVSGLTFTCPAFPVDTAPALRRGKGLASIEVENADGVSTLADEVVYWDPAAEPSCATFLERGGYGEHVAGGGANGLKWTCRKDLRGDLDIRNSDGANALYTPHDDRGKEPRLVGTASHSLSDDAHTVAQFCGGPSGGLDISLPRTIALGYRSVNNTAPGGHGYQDPEPLLHEQGGGVEFAIGHSASGFAASVYDNAGMGWVTSRAAAPANAQNIGIMTHEPGTQLRVRANGSAWDVDALTGTTSNYALAAWFGVQYSGAVYATGTTYRFAMFARGVWSDARCARLEHWHTYRHGGNRETEDLAPCVGEIWYCTSEVVHSGSPGRVIAKGKGFNVAGLAVLFITDGAIGYATDLAIHDDATISFVPPSGGGFSGKATMMVFGTGLHCQLVDAIEYFNPFNADRTPIAAWRVGDTGERTTSGTPTVVTALGDYQGEATRDMSGPSPGTFGAGANAPRLYASDIRYGRQDTCGGRASEVRNLGHALPGSPQSFPATVYNWASPNVHRNFSTPTFYFLNNNGTDGAGFVGYWNNAGNERWTFSGATGPSAVTEQDIGRASCHITQYGGGAGECYVGINDWLAGEFAATGSNRIENTLSIGTYPGETGVGWRFAARLMFSGLDSYATRRTMVKWGENFFQVGDCDVDQFPDLVFLYRPGDYTDVRTGDTNTRAWFPSGGSIAGYDTAYRLFDLGIAGSTTTATIEDDGVPLFPNAANFAMTGATAITLASCNSTGLANGDTTFFALVDFANGGINTDTVNGWTNNNICMDSGGFFGMTCKRTGTPGSYSYFVGCYAFTATGPGTGYTAWTDVTSLLDADGVGQLFIAIQKAGDRIRVSVNGGAFGDEVTLSTDSLSNVGGTMRLQGPYVGTGGKVRVYGAVKRAITNGEVYHLNKTFQG